jgi:hypothetical protein
MWGLLFVAFNIVPPWSVRHLFGTWLNQFKRKLKRHALVVRRLFTEQYS